MSRGFMCDFVKPGDAITVMRVTEMFGLVPYDIVECVICGKNAKIIK